MSSGTNVLIINQYFPPDTSATASVFSDLASSLAAGGHNVTVLCGRPSYNVDERRPSQTTAGVRVVRVSSTAFERGRLAGRACNYLTFMALAVVRKLSFRDIDVTIVGTDPPLAVSTATSVARRAPVIYFIQDLHPEAAVAAGWIKGRRVARMWDRANVGAMKRSASVVCIGADMAERVTSKGIEPSKIQVIPNGAVPAEGDVDAGVVADLRGEADFVAVHAGNLGAVGAWDTLAETQQKIGNEARFVFVGDGSQSARLKAMRLTVVPFRPVHELPSVMAAGDLQVVTMRSGMAGLVVPSKLYTALVHGRPILAVVPSESEVARLVTEWRCGIVADPDDPEDVAGKILHLKRNPQELAEMTARANEAGRHFDRKQLFARFDSLVRELSNETVRR